VTHPATPDPALPGILRLKTSGAITAAATAAAPFTRNDRRVIMIFLIFHQDSDFLKYQLFVINNLSKL